MVLVKELSGENMSVIDCANCINRAVLCQRSNDVDRIIQEVYYFLEGQDKIYLSVCPIDVRN